MDRATSTSSGVPTTCAGVRLTGAYEIDGSAEPGKDQPPAEPVEPPPRSVCSEGAHVARVPLVRSRTPMATTGTQLRNRPDGQLTLALLRALSIRTRGRVFVAAADAGRGASRTRFVATRPGFGGDEEQLAAVTSLGDVGGQTIFSSRSQLAGLRRRPEPSPRTGRTSGHGAVRLPGETAPHS
jgi:hypothetical protein